MMSENLKPARAIYPGRIIARELEARGWTQKDLAKIMNRPEQMVSEIIRGKKQITPETAFELAAVFGTSAELWNNFEANYRLHLAQQKQPEENQIARKSRLYSLLPIREIIYRGWINQGKTLDEQEQAVCKFLGITSLDNSVNLAVCFRSTASNEPDRNAQLAWFKRVEYLANRKKVARFDLNNLKKRLPDILALTEKKDDIAKLLDLLDKLGIHFHIVPYLSKTYLDGAAFYVDNNPGIALTLRYDRIDNFWFTFMHELAHIIEQHVQPGQPGIIDVDVYDKQNQWKLKDKSREKLANNHAATWLIDQSKLDKATRNCDKYTEQDITDLANQFHRHPAIILGRLQYLHILEYHQFRQLLEKVSDVFGDKIDRTN